MEQNVENIRLQVIQYLVGKYSQFLEETITPQEVEELVEVIVTQ